MALGRRSQQRQQEFWIQTQSLPDVPRHVFYDKLNQLLDDGGFDQWIEGLCAEFYSDSTGRPGIPPGTYFRMLFIGYFEDIDSQRGIAWRCADSLSLRKFLGYQPNESTPDHSSLSRIAARLPPEVHDEVFLFVLELADSHRLLSHKTVAVDSTQLEANAAMKSIVRRDNGDSWKEYLRKLAAEEGVEIKDDNDLRKFDKTRKNKTVSNEDWKSPSDPDARISKMKNGTTHLSYKAEHTVDVDSEIILDATVYHGNEVDTKTLKRSVERANHNLEQIGKTKPIREVIADKGYHANETLHEVGQIAGGTRTFIPEGEQKYEHRWTDKPPELEQAYRNNRRRVKTDRGKQLQKQRSELVERSFAHVCETGGARRMWLRGIEKVNKRYKLAAAARNLGLIMRKLFGVGKPRCLQGLGALLFALFGGHETFRDRLRTLLALIDRTKEQMEQFHRAEWDRNLIVQSR